METGWDYELFSLPLPQVTEPNRTAADHFGFAQLKAFMALISDHSDVV